MLDDARLKAWRDALVAGELPSPARADRWQVLRAGVVNLWEFEVTEYWYADGWVQLTGGNETGKSSLMALTTLIPWLADVASNNIDTLGRSGKTFRYYVEPTGRNADRRERPRPLTRGGCGSSMGAVPSPETSSSPRSCSRRLAARLPTCG